MATSVCRSAVLIVAFLYLALLLPSVIGEGMLSDGRCLILSGTWKGICLDTYTCDIQCRDKEGALGGGCPDFHCWCKYNHCGTICRKPSGIWKGLCFHTDRCKKQCMKKENAVGGYCDNDFKCQCLFDC